MVNIPLWSIDAESHGYLHFTASKTQEKAMMRNGTYGRQIASAWTALEGGRIVLNVDQEKPWGIKQGQS